MSKTHPVDIASHCVTDLRSLRAYIMFCKERDPDVSVIILPFETYVDLIFGFDQDKLLWSDTAFPILDGVVIRHNKNWELHG